MMKSTKKAKDQPQSTARAQIEAGGHSTLWDMERHESHELTRALGAAGVAISYCDLCHTYGARLDRGAYGRVLEGLAWCATAEVLSHPDLAQAVRSGEQNEVRLWWQWPFPEAT